MAKVKDKSALEKIIQARTNLLVSNGFFGYLCMQLRLVEEYIIPTAAVDGRSLFYNPDFIHQLTEREIEFVVAHEVMHCCFQHFTRRGPREPRRWNRAGDYVINYDLQESGFALIPQGKVINGRPFSILIDAKYKNMPTEEVYEMLPPSIIINITIKGENGEDGDEWNIGAVLDAPGGAGGEEQAKQEWEMSVRQAVAIAKAEGAGKVPGSLKRMLDQLNKPKVSWRDKTRNFVDQSMSKEISWSRISRRSLSIGTLMPGVISDRLNHLIFIIDTSGSVSEKMAREFLSEVAGALDENVADQLTVLYADTRVHDVDHFVPGDLVTGRTLENGGGGTAFSDSFKWVADNAPDASAVIYLTDLQVHDFGEDPGCPTLWAVFGPESSYDHLAMQAPFGTCIHVGDSIG